MYAKYVKEREGLEEIKTDRGFIHFKIKNGIGWINDIYILPEFRKDGHATFLANQVFELCKERGVKEVGCQSDERANGHDLSKTAIENFGFELYHKSGDLNYYKMEVSEWEKQ